MCRRPAGDPRHRLAATAVLAIVAFAGCGATDAPAPSSDERASPSDRTDSPTGKADIYGRDGRREYFETDSPTLRRVADATAMLVGADDLEPTDGDGWAADDGTLHEVRGVCRRERFSDQPAPGECTGFLVDDDTLVTAGHCMRHADPCEQMRAVFGFRYEHDSDEPVTDLSANDIYRCEEILHRDDTDGGADFAVLRLDRPVEDRPSLAIRRTGKIADEAPLAIVGHPVGLPLKIDRGGRVVDNDSPHQISYNLDSYGGNSGSPVVDPSTGRVEAVHVRGTPDFRPDLEKSCLVSYECAKVTPGTRCRGNGGTRTTALAPFVLPDEPDDGTYRFTDADDTLAQSDESVTAKIYVPAIGDIEQLWVVTRLAAGGKARIGVRLERGTDEGGEVVRLLRDQMLAGKWRRDFPVAKFVGRAAEGGWRIVVEVDDPSRLDVETLAIEIRTK
ncbi:MAG: serine protease [Bradymonadaceae bacterium]